MRVNTVHEAELTFEVEALKHRIAELEYRARHHSPYIIGPPKPQDMVIAPGLSHLTIIADWETRYDVGGWQIIGRTRYPKDKHLGYSHWVSEPEILTARDCAHYLMELHQDVLEAVASFIRHSPTPSEARDNE